MVERRRMAVVSEPARMLDVVQTVSALYAVNHPSDSLFARGGKGVGTRGRPYESGRLGSLSLASMKRDRKSRPLRSSSSMPMSATFSGLMLRRSWARALAKAMMGEVARGRRGPRMGFLYQR